MQFSAIALVLALAMSASAAPADEQSLESRQLSCPAAAPNLVYGACCPYNKSKDQCCDPTTTGNFDFANGKYLSCNSPWFANAMAYQQFSACQIQSINNAGFDCTNVPVAPLCTSAGGC